MRAKPTSPRLTFENAVDIHRRLWFGEPQHQIAASFGVNQGRVSEIAAEKRHAGSKTVALHGRSV